MMAELLVAFGCVGDRRLRLGSARFRVSSKMCHVAVWDKPQWFTKPIYTHFLRHTACRVGGERPTDIGGFVSACCR